MVLKLNLMTFFLKIMHFILASNLNQKCVIQKSIFSTSVFKVDNKLQTKVTVKPTDRLSYLHSKWGHPNSTKKRFAYSQALRFNRSDLHNNCKRLFNTLTKRGHNKTNTTTEINLADSVPRKELLNKIKIYWTFTTYCYV